jgi:dynactin complex subunit
MATIPDITMAEAPKQGKVKAEKGMASKKPVKLYHGKQRRESERIKVNQLKKPIKGVGSTATEPIVINEADEGVLTQEEHPKLGTCFRSMKSWKNLREN